MLVGATPGVAQKGTCGVRAKPSGKVLRGHWENWDGAPTVRPTVRIRHSVGFRSPTAASRATAVKVPTPAEMCEAKGAGLTTLMSIGGATAGIGLGSSAVADRFVDTVVPILKECNFDGVDIETGLTGSGDINQLSTSQVDLIRIIDGRLPAHCEEVRGQCRLWWLNMQYRNGSMYGCALTARERWTFGDNVRALQGR